VRLLACLLALSACHARTELMVGVVTDIEVPGAIDTVELDVTHDGKPVFDPKTWSISGVPDVPFALPGSFALVASSGSPGIHATVIGMKSGQEVVRREAVVSLVEGKTLFMRMALVRRCIPAQCPTGQTCIEGRCQDWTLDSSTLPPYVQGLENLVTCGSGSTFVDTGTGMPLAPSGSGDCNADEQCSEGTCYKLPPAMMQAVSGQRIVTHVSEVGETPVPEDLSLVKLSAISGGQTFPGTGAADGTFSIPNVPPGPYQLVIDRGKGALFSHQVSSGARAITLDGAIGGRTDAVNATKTTNVTLQLSNVDAWDPSNPSAGFEFICFNNGAVDYSAVVTSPMPPLMGVTSINVTWDYFTANGIPILVDATKGDKPLYSQLSSRTLPDSTTFGLLTKVFFPTPFTMIDGQPITISGAMSDVVADQPVSIDLRRSQFDALRAKANPNAQPWDASLRPYLGTNLQVIASPFLKLHGDIAQGTDLMRFMPGIVDVQWNGMYGNPYPADWGPLAIALTVYEIPVQVPGTTQPTTVQASNIIEDRLSALSGNPIVPRISPPENITVDGQPLFGTLAGISLTPTVSWDPPAIGSANFYVVQLLELVAQGGQAMERSRGGGDTAGTSLTLPPGMLVSGHFYVLQVGAYQVSAASPERQPNVALAQPPITLATATSGLFTP
jgi:hypothetical protein